MEQITHLVEGAITALFVGILTILIAILIGFILQKTVRKVRFRKKLEKYLINNENTFLSIKIPQSSEQKEKAMESFLSSLHRVLPTGSIISLELVSQNQFLHFYIVVPKQTKSLVKSQLYAQFHDAEVEEVNDYFSSWKDKTAIVDIGFKHSSIYPINTYEKMEDDLLKNLSAVLAQTEGDEEVAIQIVLKRVSSKSLDRGLKALYMQFMARLDGSPAYQKVSQDLYVGRLRVAYTAQNLPIATSKLHTILNLYKIVKGERNKLVKKRVFFVDDLVKSFQTRLFEQGDLWSIRELATIYHFPYQGTIVSNVSQTTSKRAPAPDILPIEGNVDAKEVSLIGQTNYRNEQKVFGLKRFDRRRHVYVVGKTGSGKSKLLELLLKADIENGNGCCLIDPHGDLANEILKYVPKSRVKDVVFVDPTDRNFPVGFNPLDPVEDYEMRQHLSIFFIAIFKKLFAGNWNPRIEHLIRYITLALLETPDSNVLGISRILSDTAFRQRVIKQIQDPVVKSFWTNDFKPSDAQYANEAIVPLMNKVGQFISNPLIRNIIGQKKNVLHFDTFMNEGKIVVISLSKGKVGRRKYCSFGFNVYHKNSASCTCTGKNS